MIVSKKNPSTNHLIAASTTWPTICPTTTGWFRLSVYYTNLRKNLPDAPGTRTANGTSRA